MDTAEIYDQIEQYLAGELTGVDLKNFEAKLQAEPAFAEKVNLFKGMEAALSDPKALEVQQKAAALGDEFFENIGRAIKAAPIKKMVKQETAKVVPFYRKPWAIAASLALAATAGGGLWQMQGETALTNDQLFAQNYQTYQVDGLVRGTTTDEELTNAIQLYQNKSYQNAAEVLLILNEKDIDNQEVMFVLANAYLNQTPPELEKAANFFNQLIDMNTSIYVPKAQWYLALIYIKQDKVEQAKLLLAEVVVSGDTNAEEAKEILERIVD